MVRHSKETREKALELLAAGHTSIYVGKLLEISDSTVRSWDRAERKKKEEAGFEPAREKLDAEVRIRVRKVLAHIDEGLEKVEIKTALDLKNLVAALATLGDILLKLDLDKQGRKGEETIPGFSGLTSSDLDALRTKFGKTVEKAIKQEEEENEE